MKFGELQVGDKFKFEDSRLVWTKMKSCTAYGHIKNQNASYCSSQDYPGTCQWHFDHVADDEEVTKV